MLVNAGSMKQLQVALPEKKLIGLQIRTNNQTEIDQTTGKIFPLICRFFTVMDLYIGMAK